MLASIGCVVRAVAARRRRRCARRRCCGRGAGSGCACARTSRAGRDRRAPARTPPACSSARTPNEEYTTECCCMLVYSLVIHPKILFTLLNLCFFLQVTLSELCPQLTKIVTLLPYFLVYNDTKKHLRFMEENEAADLWIDLAPQQCTPFWPQTDSMSMHCKYRDSNVVSQHFPITKNHFTVLRMDKGVSVKCYVM